MTTTENQQKKSLFISLLWRILASTLLAGILPLAYLIYSALDGYKTASAEATEIATTLLDGKSLETLRLWSQNTSEELAKLLDNTVQETFSLSYIPKNPASYRLFYNDHVGTINYRDHVTNGTISENIPLYREISYINKDGIEEVRIADGTVLFGANLRDVSNPANTTYLTENYFTETKNLQAGEIYVSKVLAWHTSNPKQNAYTSPEEYIQWIDLDPALRDNAETSEEFKVRKANESLALNGEKYGSYNAIIRFATPIFNGEGQFDGIVVISLDHRHLMEKIVHITPGRDIGEEDMSQNWESWSSYASGNYAFAWDSDGILIAHPVLARLRGMDEEGNSIPSIIKGTEREIFPEYVYDMSTDANDELTQIHQAVLQGDSFYSISENLQGVKKANVYSPIHFNYGQYKDKGIFGGVIIGANVNDFHRAANRVQEAIEKEQKQFQKKMLVGSTLGIAFLIIVGIILSRNITRPILKLTDAAHIMEDGELDTSILDALLDRKVDDEVTTLTRVFKDMAEKVQLREKKLKEQILELKIEINQQQKDEQVSQIVESDYFKSLQANARNMRARYRNRPNDSAAEKTESEKTESNKPESDESA